MITHNPPQDPGAAAERRHGRPEAKVVAAGKLV